MPKFSAIVYASNNDERRLEKTPTPLEDAQDVLLFKGDCGDRIHDIGRRFRAPVKQGIPGVTPALISWTRIVPGSW